MLLRDYLKTHRIKLRDFAASLDKTETAVRKWAYGQRQPTLTDALAVQRATGGLVTCADLHVAAPESAAA